MPERRDLSGGVRLARRGAALAVVVALAAPVPSAGQELEPLATSCGGSDSDLVALCREAALLLRQTHGGMALMASGGADLPGAASTLGRRFGSTPRFAVTLRGGATRVPLPDADAVAPGAPSDAFWGTALRAQATIGLFDGFSLVPTVGGVLSLDVILSAGLLFLPEDRGFDGTSASVGFGARLGVLRESFTTPGVTVSLVHRTLGGAAVGDRETGPLHAAADPGVTSVRATVGKDLLGVGVLAGYGWDRVTSDGSIQARRSSLLGGTVVGQATAEGFRTTRSLFYGGLAMNFLVIQLSAEAGWAEGLDPVPQRPEAGLDPEAASFFAGLAVRLTI